MTDRISELQSKAQVLLNHITVRMAWHDNAWDGNICLNPSANSYCNASHSLLSDRIARDKNTELESEREGQSLDVLVPDYIPPCYWSSSAFSAKTKKAFHAHPFKNHRDKRVTEDLPPYSTFTWPLPRAPRR